MVPHLNTTLTGPINELEQRMLDWTPAIERWFRLEWMEHTPLFYSAVDVRNAGFKLAPVGLSLFPAEWSHLDDAMLPLAVQAAQAAIEKICPEARNLLIVPENRFPSDLYLTSLLQLRRIFQMAGLNVRIGSIDPKISEPVSLESPSGERLMLEPALRSRGRLGVQDFDPCAILLNNDLRAGAPGILEELRDQYLLPPVHAGWATRRKSVHARCYEDIAKRFGKLIGVDSWLIHPWFDACSEVDLSNEAGLDALRASVDAVLAKTRKRYREYRIKEKPFVVVKADDDHPNWRARSVRDAKEINAEFLAACSRTRSGWTEAPQDFMVQEGVYTHERVEDAVAEPVVYTMDRYVVGGFYRVQAGREAGEVLHTPGANFVPLAFAQGTQLPKAGVQPGVSAPNRFYIYGVVARMALLAGSYELEVTEPQPEAWA